ncbi:Aldehyde Dehydrogenase (plasmid) [Haloterrigena turkmenica DSM 5511]|uniref:Aldehyde Dehydrogenase n=1 Tax=Haloterrigena turkmenica (strain ATCC 51198 / DSM 5511 / JCM 9101 / NCIMB 13204 / VKM B-1734 / 4k) TaxID=543526 RepID=D2S2D8_HALTV|nr:aldehyde dehydrogenase family protein [Haloterrigena turkmenica]ADB63535.1 Aldehyde Dehydrogenase [Haloterrigena turkmenica DSM 5511]
MTADSHRHSQAHAIATDISSFDAWIGGDSYRTDEVLETRDPFVDEPITTVARCREDDIDAAVEAAWAGYDSVWSETTPAERSQTLFEWIDVLRENVEDLTLLECLDTGKPKSDARGEVEGAIDTLEYYASLCRSPAQDGRQIPARNDLHTYTQYEPYGVVGQITPWNFPIWSAAWKLGPALAAGNATVLKPSAVAPLTTLRIAELSAEILPDGVLNVTPGNGSEAGSALTAHENVRKLSFTGSTAVGKHVMEAAASHIAPITLELGGKSPFIVFPDADLEKVVNAVADGIYYSTGEICDAFSRAIVHEDVADEFVDRFVAKANSYTLGDPLDSDTTMGPLTTREQYETVEEYVEIATAEGATLAVGGEAPDDPTLAAGWYYEPTVFTDVDNDMRIAREEVFGPVQTVQTFDTYEEGIAIANDTDYGLAAGIGTERTDLAHNAASDLEAGVIYVNEYGPILPEGPYTGFKNSGIGNDLGVEALDHYRQSKTVYVNLEEPSI